MTTTPQTLTLAGEDYVVIPRDEYERLHSMTHRKPTGRRPDGLAQGTTSRDISLVHHERLRTMTDTNAC